MPTTEINKGAAACYVWAGLQNRRWGDRATGFIKVSLGQRAQGEGGMYMVGV